MSVSTNAQPFAFNPTLIQQANMGNSAAAAPVSSAAQKPAQQPLIANTIGHNDAFERAMNHPSLQLKPDSSFIGFTLTHPFQTMHIRSSLPTLPGEPKLARVAMYQQLYNSLSRDGRGHLQSLLRRGVLNDARSDDGHSTLYHLYAMLTTPREKGYRPENVVNETVRILNRPYYITQKFDKLSEAAAQQILSVRNNFPMYQNKAGELPPSKPLTWDDINFVSSAECVPSSIMYSMADQYPAELTRELAQLTSPIQGFYRKVTLTDLSPDNPAGAYQILQNHNIHYAQAGQNHAWIKVELPAAGLIRSVDTNQHAPINNVRTGIEAAYQSALTFLATRSYDPATDYRDSDAPGQTSKGLTEMEKTLIETLIKGNGGVASVTYQVVAGKVSPTPEEEGQPFLYGYTRTFEQTASDIIKALRMGQFVVVGITETEPNGAIPSSGGHEITITSAFVDPQDKQLKFYVIDSDDDIDRPVVRSARELIPKIHHAGMPWALAKEIRNEIESHKNFYYVTDQQDMARFDTLAHLQDQLPSDAVSPPIISPATEELPQPNAPTAAPIAAASPEVLYDDPTPAIDPNNIHTHWQLQNLYQPSQQAQLANSIVTPQNQPQAENNPLAAILNNPATNPSQLTSEQIYQLLQKTQQPAPANH